MNEKFKIVEDGVSGSYNSFFDNGLFRASSNLKCTWLSSDVPFFNNIFLEGDLSKVIKSNKECFEILILADKLDVFIAQYRKQIEKSAIRDFKQKIKELLNQSCTLKTKTFGLFAPSKLLPTGMVFCWPFALQRRRPKLLLNNLILNIKKNQKKIFIFLKICSLLLKKPTLMS